MTLTIETIDWAASSRRDMRQVDDRTRERIRRAVDRCAVDGHGDVKRLPGRDWEWRLRVGDWRVSFTFPDAADPDHVLILRVLPRGRAYRD